MCDCLCFLNQSRKEVYSELEVTRSEVEKLEKQLFDIKVEQATSKLIHDFV